VPFNPGVDLELIGRFADIGQIDRRNVSAVDIFDFLMAARREIGNIF
jgi:hypothetical protein